jgi:hypothetical protein
MSEPTDFELLCAGKKLKVGGIEITMRPISIEQEILNIRAFMKVAAEVAACYVNADGTVKKENEISTFDLIRTMTTLTEEVYELLPFCIDKDIAGVPGWELFDLVAEFVEMNFHSKAVERFLALKTRLERFMETVSATLTTPAQSSTVLVEKNEPPVTSVQP